ncbi:aryl-sulfate sulfotransferase [bacterium]|nr:aryl-sulfate sulfotransferase [bacterium]
MGTGLYKIERDGHVLWEHRDPKISHDADLLPGGNIIYVYGMGDMKSDTTVKEIRPDGSLAWSWRASDYFNYSPFSDIDPVQGQGWAHTNAVTRLNNGHTLISMRNFDMIVEVNPQGVPVDTILNVVRSPHDPEVIDSEYLLAAHQSPPAHSAKKVDRITKEVVWQYDVTDRSQYPMRDVNLLPNGNILITNATRLIEVDPSDNQIVWQLELTGSIPEGATPSRGFYKAERITD